MLLTQKNIELNNSNNVLSSKKIERAGTRDQLAKIALLVTATVGIGAALGYFLIAAVVIVISPVALYILASIAIAAIVGLFVASGVFWIGAQMSQSEIDENQSKINDNLRLVDQNRMQSMQIKTHGLPEIDSDITSYEHEVERGEQHLNQAQQIANQSLAKAVAIGVESVRTASVTDGRFNLFPVPSAPPAYEQVARDSFNPDRVIDLDGIDTTDAVCKV